MGQHWLEPNWEPSLSLPNLPIKHFLDRGIKALILDVDKTLLHGKCVIVHNSVKSWVREANQQLELYLLSNNPSKSRIGSVANQLGLRFRCGASKPRRKAIKKVMNEMQFMPEEIAMIGDRVFTDVLVGNRLGLYTVLVHPIGPDGKPCTHNNLQNLERALSIKLGAKRK